MYWFFRLWICKKRKAWVLKTQPYCWFLHGYVSKLAPANYQIEIQIKEKRPYEGKVTKQRERDDRLATKIRTKRDCYVENSDISLALRGLLH